MVVQKSSVGASGVNATANNDCMVSSLVDGCVETSIVIPRQEAAKGVA